MSDTVLQLHVSSNHFVVSVREPSPDICRRKIIPKSPDSVLFPDSHRVLDVVEIVWTWSQTAGGLAGLSCAVSLLSGTGAANRAREAPSVALLEWQERLGGRLYTCQARATSIFAPEVRHGRICLT